MSLKRILKFAFGRLRRPSAARSSYAPVGDTYRGKMAEQYLQRRVTQEYWMLEQRTMDRLLASLPRCQAVLDVPIGTGRFVPLYLARGLEVFGLDRSPDMLSVARRELKELFLRCRMQIGDAQRLPYRDAAFDLVVSFRFLSHVVSFAEAKAALGELRRVARRAAFLQLRVRRPDVPAAGPIPEDEAMGDRLPVPDLTNLLHKNGFVVRDIVPLEGRETYYRAVFCCDAE